MEGRSPDRPRLVRRPTLQKYAVRHDHIRVKIGASCYPQMEFKKVRRTSYVPFLALPRCLRDIHFPLGRINMSESESRPQRPVGRPALQKTTCPTGGGSVSRPTEGMNAAGANPALPQRLRPAHPSPVAKPNQSVIIFLTVCTKKRRSLLATNEVHRALQAAWSRATHWLVGRYVIMPDHIHLFCAPGVIPPRPLGLWVRFWKSSLCKALKAEEGTLWQPNFWDTQLRQHESYATKWEYVRANPVRAGLVANPDDWPNQGEMNLLRWHD